MANVLSETVGAILTALGWDGMGFRAFTLDGDGHLQVDVLSIVPGLHHDTHENGGADEIAVTGLSGTLADEQPFAAHLLGGAKHTADSLADLNTLVNDATLDDSGDPRDPNAHAASHENGGADEISVVDLSGLLADGQTPLAHHASHENGGADEISLTGLSGMDKAITFIIDGGGAEIAVGQHGHLEIPFACDIQSVTMYADQSGTIVVDIWNDTYANFPPTDADSITAAAHPTIGGAQKSFNDTLTGWTTALAAHTCLAYNVDSVITIERVTICLHVRTH